MTTLESQIAQSRRNNLNIIRLLLALMVIFSHSFPVALGRGGESWGEPFFVWTHRQMSAGAIAVGSFFFISGFLIAASWMRSRSALDYFRKRVLRIYPGFVFAMGFSAIVVWGCCPDFRAAVDHPTAWVWLMLKDLLFLSANSLAWPGIFSGNPFPAIANASLWTIPIEFGCYIAVTMVGIFGLFKRRFVFLVLAGFSYEFFVMSDFHAQNEVDQLIISFIAGAAFWLWRDKIPFSEYIALGCLLALAAASRFTPLLTLVFPIAGGYLLIWVAYGLRPLFSNWADGTDLSYGTYLYAFPIQQVLAMIPVLRHPYILFLAAAPVTLALAWLSWNLVEKRFLAMKESIRLPILNHLRNERDLSLKKQGESIP